MKALSDEHKAKLQEGRRQARLNSKVKESLGDKRFDSKRHDLLENVSTDGPIWYRLFVSVFMRKASPRAAIKAKCGECVWLKRELISDCKATECPLWEYRPFKS